MRVYSQEQRDGVADLLSNQTIAYTCALFDGEKQGLPFSVQQLHSNVGHAAEKLSFDGRSLAEVQDTDLYFCYSVLVSTNWNKNDDVFSPAETWVARHTPSHKPTNVNHDEKQIVGHLSDCWVVDENGSVIADTTAIDDLPTFFHIINGSVIYRQWLDVELKNRAVSLIQDIQNGKKFVSMECLFSDFDYATMGADGTYNIVNRNAETAFLTKHLRAYGGDGKFKDYKIGRLLKNILFSGKGFVDNPANEYSVILHNDKITVDHDVNGIAADVMTFPPLLEFPRKNAKNSDLKDDGVFSLQEQLVALGTIKSRENNMSEDTLKTQVSTLEKELKDARAEATKLRDQAVKAATDKLETRVTELTSALDTAVEAQKASEAQIVDISGQLKQATDELAVVVAERDELKTQVADLTAANIQEKRISILVNGGIDHEIAKQKVSLLAKLDDDSFDAIAKDLISLATKSQEQPTEAAEPSDTVEADVDADVDAEDADEVLQPTVASEDTVDTVPSDDIESEIQVVRASVANFISNSL